MAFQKIQLRPGINNDPTPTLNSGGWSFSNLIRFRNGLLEKIGGWLHYSNTATIGIARALHSFQDLNSIDYLAVGTNQRLQIYSNGIVTDITPIRKTSNLSSALSTMMSSASVEITDTAHGAVVGDWINMYVSYSIGGLILYGFYTVTTVIDANHYTITAASAATSTVTLGGNTPQFTTTLVSNSVKVTFNTHSLSIGSVFNIQVPLVVGGLTIQGSYLVNTVIDANNFTILNAGSASSSTSAYENSDEARIEYLLPTGNVSDVVEMGWGTGPWGIGPWGESSGGTYISPLRNWFLDNFGQDLVAVPTNGTLYEWIPPVSLGNVATAVTNAPLYASGMFVAMPQAQVVMLGAETSGTQDPLLVRWCDSGNITDWTAAVTNQAGSYRLSRGSKIIGGFQGPQTGLIWTDIDMWTMSYTGYPFVYSFTTVGEQCGLISPKGANIIAGISFWMSLKGFYLYSGSSGVQYIPCTVWDEIFQRLDTNNTDKIFAAPNSLFNEMAWFFPSTDSSNPTSGEIDSYVKYNVVENLWDYGSLIRFSWIDENIIGNPIAVDGSNIIQQHEVGYDNDGSAMTGVYAQSGYVDIAAGEIFIFVDWMVPDFTWNTINPMTSPHVTITIYTLYTPGDPTPFTFGPFTVTPNTPYFSFRARARQMSIKVECDALDTFFRIGSIRYRGAPSGRV